MITSTTIYWVGPLPGPGLSPLETGTHRFPQHLNNVLLLSTHFPDDKIKAQVSWKQNWDEPQICLTLHYVGALLGLPSAFGIRSMGLAWRPSLSPHPQDGNFNFY